MRKPLLISLLLAGGVAHAASFDCTKAKTPQEKAVCASPKLSTADDQMAAAYRAVLAATTPEIAAELRDAQRAWNRRMKAQCLAGASMAAAAQLETCLLDSYYSRTKALQHMVLREDGVTFVWRSITLRDAADPDYGVVNLSWPQAMSEAPNWRAWNKAIEEATRNMNSGENGDATASIGIVTDRVVTASIYSSWTGGIHPDWSSTEINWLLKERRELRPEDVFLPASGWDLAIQVRCDKALRKQLGPHEEYESYLQPGEMPKVLHSIILDPKNWGLEPQGLIIVFQPYSVSPHADPADPVAIPWNELKTFLQSSFVIPK